MRVEELYKPEIIEDFQLAGFCAETVADGETAIVVQKTFITSLEKDFLLIAKNFLSLIVPFDPGASLNSLLVIIKPDNKGYIYYDFPFGFQVVAKRDLKAHHAVFKKDIVDITSVFFKDVVIDLNPQDGDRVIWLFRQNWTFGLFFDLSGTLKSESVLEEMGVYYRKLAYLSEYLFLEKSSNFTRILEDGWFPFVTLIGESMEDLRTYYEEGEEHPSIMERLISSFDEERLTDITSRWWGNPLFNSKKKILQAGVNSYLANTEEGYINSVKNLSTELEGIIRVSYYTDYGKNPSSIKELKEYITNKGKNKFSSLGSLCFPDKFLDYLSGYIFKSFDVQAGKIPESRHSVAHGVAQDDVYNREFALKIILTLDNIYFFLGGKP
ncbi:hypothetical protein H6F86_16920 [Phormidium sp. FACHB-592]|uniref:Apea-like HEPN domain-containing protein n=1 Tax=Stenomitos frigidus AS-A4 TaxID=2933935 RepID=A0ABV0KR54_9CYAN|nr:hypothetical protein [Phormidium sp. FACHB-592]MBD2075549.1 hypothetical protein [Phormidium sp. FACHB-592]